MKKQSAIEVMKSNRAAQREAFASKLAALKAALLKPEGGESLTGKVLDSFEEMMEPSKEAAPTL